MRNNRELLSYLIANEKKSIETMSHLNKEDEITILRLQNKLAALKKEIEGHKQLIKEYRSRLGSISKSAHKRPKPMPVTSPHSNMGTSK